MPPLTRAAAPSGGGGISLWDVTDPNKKTCLTVVEDPAGGDPYFQFEKACIVKLFNDMNPVVNAAFIKDPDRSGVDNVVFGGSSGDSALEVTGKGGRGNDTIDGGCGNDAARHLRPSKADRIEVIIGDVIDEYKAASGGVSASFVTKAPGGEYALVVILAYPRRRRLQSWEEVAKYVAASLDAIEGDPVKMHGTHTADTVSSGRV